MTEKTRTMIVEDQPLQRQITEQALTASGRYEVMSAIDNADLADLYVDSLRIELVLMDVYTALGADGLAAAERIKEQFPQTKVINHTAKVYTVVSRKKQVVPAIISAINRTVSEL